MRVCRLVVGLNAAVTLFIGLGLFGYYGLAGALKILFVSLFPVSLVFGSFTLLGLVCVPVLSATCLLAGRLCGGLRLVLLLYIVGLLGWLPGAFSSGLAGALVLGLIVMGLAAASAWCLRGTG